MKASYRGRITKIHSQPMCLGIGLINLYRALKQGSCYSSNLRLLCFSLIRVHQVGKNCALFFCFSVGSVDKVCI